MRQPAALDPIVLQRRQPPAKGQRAQCLTALDLSPARKGIMEIRGSNSLSRRWDGTLALANTLTGSTESFEKYLRAAGHWSK